jgi:cytochrome P450
MGSAPVATSGLSPPVLSGKWLLGSLRDFGRDPLDFLATTARTHGDVVCYRLGPYTFYLVSHPDGVQRILVDNNRNYTRNGSVTQAALRPAIGNSLVISDGEQWLFRRQVPVFIHRQVAVAEIICERPPSCRRLGASRRVHQPLDIVSTLPMTSAS